MAEITRGLRGVLNHAGVYRFFQWLVGAPRLRRHIASQILGGESARLRILDVGCGPADVLEHLPDVDYVGLDLSSDYVQAARRRFAGRAEFFQQELGSQSILQHGLFDRILAVGLLHHLDDEATLNLLICARNGLRPGGFMMTVDACFAPEQSRLARWLISRDRGQNVRTPQAYEALARRVFPEVRVDVRHDLLNIPYSHTLLKLSGNP